MPGQPMPPTHRGKGAWPRAEDIEHFERHGFAIVHDVLDAGELELVREGLFRVYPTPEAVAARSDDPRVARYAVASSRSRGEPGRRFRAEQYVGLREFPFDALALDTAPFHPRLIALAERLLATREVRLYQAETFAKYQGVTDYEQPLHIDYTNHSLLPPRPRGRPVQIQLFLYLSDVTAACGPPHVVSREHTASLPLMDLVFGADGRRPRIDPVLEVAAIAPAGAALVYAADVAHRATEITEPGAGRFTYNLGYRRADSDWAGGSPYARKGLEPGFGELVSACTPRQLELLGFPSPGHSYWTEETLSGAAALYPGLDLSPWRRALGVRIGVA